MKSYYWFIRRTEGFSVSDIAYKVSVGESIREVAKLTLVQQFCESTGLYFERVSAESDSHIESVAQRLFRGAEHPLLLLRTEGITINELYHAILDDDFSRWEFSNVRPVAHFHQLNTIAPSFRFQNNRLKGITKLPNPKRKYLSSPFGKQLIDVIISCAIVAILFALDSLVNSFLF